MLRENRGDPLEESELEDHRGRDDVDDGDLVFRGDRLHVPLGAGEAGDDGRPLELGPEAVEDADRDILAHGGDHGRRVQYFGAVESQLARFRKAHPRDEPRAFHDAGIGRHHTVDVGPDLDLSRVQSRAENRCGVIAAAAAERRDVARFVLGDVPGDHRHATDLREDPVDPLVHVRERPRAAEVAVGDEAGLERVERGGIDSEPAEVRRHDPYREALPETHEVILRPRRAFPDQRDPLEELLELREQRVEQVGVEAQVARARAVVLGEAVELGLPTRAAHRKLGHAKQPIRHSAHGGDHDDGLLR